MPRANSTAVDLAYSSSSDYNSDSDLEDVPLLILPPPCSKPKPSFNLQMSSLALASNDEPLLTRRPARSVLRQPATDCADRPAMTHRPSCLPSPPSLESYTANTVPLPDIANTTATTATVNSPADQDMTWVYLLSPAFALEGTAIGNGDVPHDGIHAPVRQFIYNYFRSSFGMEAADLSLFKVASAGPGTQIAVQFNGKGFTTQKLEDLLVEVNNLQTANQALQDSNKSLQDELKALQFANRSLQDELEAVQAENQELHASQVSSVNMNNNLYDDIRKFSDEVQKLNKDISNLQEERIRLAMENASLVVQEQVFKHESELLKQQVQDLWDFAGKCDQDRRQLKSVLQNLQAEMRAVAGVKGRGQRTSTSPTPISQAAPAHTSPCAPAPVPNGIRSAYHDGCNESCLSKACTQQAVEHGEYQAVLDTTQQVINACGVHQAMVDRVQQLINACGVQQTVVDSAQQATGGEEGDGDVNVKADGSRRSCGAGAGSQA